MEDMYLSRALPDAQIQRLLQAALPGLTVFPWAKLLGEAEPMEFDSADTTHIFFETLPSEVPDFPQHLAIYRTPGTDEEVRALWLGRQLAAQLGVAVLVPFTHPEKPQDPFYNIVFRQGKSYLADDRETDFGAPDAQPVRIVAEYCVPATTFDALGQRLASA